MISLAQLSAIMPRLQRRAVIFLPALNAAMSEFDISTEKRIECFLAQIAHESSDLTVLEENLNYSPYGMAKTWPNRYAAKSASCGYLQDQGGRLIPNSLALNLCKSPIAIANNVYAGRGGNGDEKSGDGWRFRGAGAIQLTFRGNQEACAIYFGISIDAVGDWLRTPEGACRSAAWFWSTHGCNSLADSGQFTKLTTTINGGTIGLAERFATLKITQKVIV